MFVDSYGFKKESSSIDKDKSVSIAETKDSININTYISIDGNDAGLTVPGTDGITYKQSFINAINQYWNGKYDNKVVNTNIIDLSYVQGAQAVDYSMMLKAKEIGECVTYSKYSDILDELKIDYKAF